MQQTNTVINRDPEKQCQLAVKGNRNKGLVTSTVNRPESVPRQPRRRSALAAGPAATQRPSHGAHGGGRQCEARSRGAMTSRRRRRVAFRDYIPMDPRAMAKVYKQNTTPLKTINLRRHVFSGVSDGFK